MPDSDGTGNDGTGNDGTGNDGSENDGTGNDGTGSSTGSGVDGTNADSNGGLGSDGTATSNDALGGSDPNNDPSGGTGTGLDGTATASTDDTQSATANDALGTTSVDVSQNVDVAQNMDATAVAPEAPNPDAPNTEVAQAPDAVAPGIPEVAQAVTPDGISINATAATTVEPETTPGLNINIDTSNVNLGGVPAGQPEPDLGQAAAVAPSSVSTIEVSAQSTPSATATATGLSGATPSASTATAVSGGPVEVASAPEAGPSVSPDSQANAAGAQVAADVASGPSNPGTAPGGNATNNETESSQAAASGGPSISLGHAADTEIGGVQVTNPGINSVTLGGAPSPSFAAPNPAPTVPAPNVITVFASGQPNTHAGSAFNTSGKSAVTNNTGIAGVTAAVTPQDLTTTPTAPGLNVNTIAGAPESVSTALSAIAAAVAVALAKAGQTLGAVALNRAASSPSVMASIKNFANALAPQAGLVGIGLADIGSHLASGQKGLMGGPLSGRAFGGIMGGLLATAAVTSSFVGGGPAAALTAAAIGYMAGSQAMAPFDNSTPVDPNQTALSIGARGFLSGLSNALDMPGLSSAIDNAIGVGFNAVFGTSPPAAPPSLSAPDLTQSQLAGLTSDQLASALNDAINAINANLGTGGLNLDNTNIGPVDLSQGNPSGIASNGAGSPAGSPGAPEIDTSNQTSVASSQNNNGAPDLGATNNNQQPSSTSKDVSNQTGTPAGSVASSEPAGGTPAGTTSPTESTGTTQQTTAPGVSATTPDQVATGQAVTPDLSGSSAETVGNSGPIVQSDDVAQVTPSSLMQPVSASFLSTSSEIAATPATIPDIQPPPALTPLSQAEVVAQAFMTLFGDASDQLTFTAPPPPPMAIASDDIFAAANNSSTAAGSLQSSDPSRPNSSDAQPPYFISEHG